MCPPLQDLILFQDEHTYRLPIMMQVVAADFDLQGSLLLERPYAPSMIDSRGLFAFGGPPCRCGELECGL